MVEAAIQSAGTVVATADGKNTVLPRDMGWGSVFVFAISSIGLTYSGLLPFSTIAGLWPGSNLAGVLTVALVLALIHAYTYAVIGAIVRRNGADYILASRVIHAPLAFASSWTLVIFMAFASGSIIASVLQDNLPMFARMLSILFGNKFLLSSLSAYTEPSGVVLFGTFAVLLLFLLLILPPQVTKRFLIIGFMLSLMVWAIFAFQMAPATSESFQAAWNRFMGEGAFLNHFAEARSAGMQTSAGPIPVLTAGFVLGFSIFFGYFNGTFFAREVKKPEKNLLRGSWAALLFSWGFLAGGAMMVQHIAPPIWLAAESYLSRLTQYRDIAMPWLPFYAAVNNPNPWLFWFVAAGWVFSMLVLAYTFLYAGSRVMMAWSDDGVLPNGVSFVHPVLRSPLIAVLLVCIAAEAGLVASSLAGGIESQINPVFFMASVQVLPVLAVTLFPFLKPEWFANAPWMVRRKIGRVPLISIVGAFSLLYLVWILSAALFFPAYSLINPPTLLLFGITFAAGLVWFLVRQTYRKSVGEQVSGLFDKLPEA